MTGLPRNYIMLLQKNYFRIALFLALFTLAPVSSKAVEDNSALLKAQKIEKEAAIFWQRGQIELAIDRWTRQQQIYQEQSLEKEQARVALKIARGYSRLNQLELASFQLEKLLPSVNDSAVKTKILTELGNLEVKKGSLDSAIAYYEESLKLNDSLATLNNIAIAQNKAFLRETLKAESSIPSLQYYYTLEAQKNRELRRKYLRKGLEIASKEQSLSSVRTLIEWSSEFGLSKKQLTRGRNIFKNTRSSRNKIFLIIEWAKIDVEQKDYWLKIAEEEAAEIQDPIAIAYTNLELAIEAQKREEYDTAIEFAGVAEAIALELSDFNLMYRAQWLLAGVKNIAGNEVEAKEKYLQAVRSLSDYFRNNGQITTEQRLDFASQIEPLYRETLELILSEEKPTDRDLEESLFVFEQLQLAKLQQFFGNNCFFVRESKNKDSEASDFIIITSINLPEETHIILQTPKGKLLHHKVSITKESLSSLASNWYSEMSDLRSLKSKEKGSKLYDIIVRPFDKILIESEFRKIVFVHDGMLRNLPMAALFDGDSEKYLAQKWASASSLSPNLTLNNKISDEAEDNSLAIFGITQEVLNFASLTGIEREINNILNIHKGKERTFINRDFTLNSLIKELTNRNYNKVHIATHGYFGGVAENSFLVAHDGYLTVPEWEQSLSPDIEILILSACETNVSSDRSVLGLAGTTLRQGVDKTLGTFWRVEDEKQAEIITDFYSYLQDFDAVEALQKAQIKQIEEQANPTNWAALNLIVN